MNGESQMCQQKWSEYPSATDTDVTASPKFFMVWIGSKERERQSHSLMAWSYPPVTSTSSLAAYAICSIASHSAHSDSLQQVYKSMLVSIATEEH